MGKTFVRRLAALEKHRTAAETAADIIRKLQEPRNADEFIAWHRSLSPVALAAYEAAALAGLDEWERKEMQDEQD